LAPVESHCQKEQDPDPVIQSTDPRIRIRIKMSLIWNTDEKAFKNIHLRTQSLKKRKIDCGKMLYCSVLTVRYICMSGCLDEAMKL
jgi:hypothetical protein